jgi:hypothetical protein
LLGERNNFLESRFNLGPLFIGWIEGLFDPLDLTFEHHLPHLFGVPLSHLLACGAAGLTGLLSAASSASFLSAALL